MHPPRWLVDALMMMEGPSRVSRKAWLITEYRAKCGPRLPEVRDVWEYDDERSILDASPAERNDEGSVELPGMDSMAFIDREISNGRRAAVVVVPRSRSPAKRQWLLRNVYPR